MTRFLLFSFLTLSFMVGVGGITPRHARANHALTYTLPASRVSQVSEDGLWQPVEEALVQRSQAERQIIPSTYRVVVLNQPVLANLLKQAPLEFSQAAQTTSTVMTLPMPDGTFSRFRIEESPVMAPELAARFPEIKTYCGQGIDDPTAIIRFDRTPAGFHAMVLSAGDTVYIDPYQKGDAETCISYFKRDYQKDTEALRCLVPPDELGHLPESELSSSSQRAPFGTTLRTYRLALAATGEYTAFHGGTVAGALAAITTSVNRVNAIYGRELAIRMVLIAQESSIIYTSSGSDPYTNDDGGQMLGQNQANLDRVIGSANYDIGHVFSTGGGGIASRGGICNSNAKARGVTGLPTPVGDSFDVDFVAHEMGHQFGANHPFNGTTGNCGGGNRAPGSAYEPGSGSTIMAYAGICGGENIQRNSDDYFHGHSMDEIISFITGNGNGCATPSATNNQPPTVEAGNSFTIPRSTPFILTASGNDPDGDAITYCWEQFDLGTQGPPNTDDGSRPIFRSFKPTTSPSRTFPQLSDILNNRATFGESLPTTSRTLNFRVTVRDNRATGGGTNFDSTRVTVSSQSGPFLVREPNTAVQWVVGSTQNVVWDVASTSQSPVNCANVRILLSTDGGQSFPITLAAETPNDGTEAVTVPNNLTSTARIKIEAVGNIFFDISNANFQIAQSASNTPPTITAVPAITQAQGGSATGVTIATVTDKETAVGNLIVQAIQIPAGLVISQIANANGMITANLSSGCRATTGTNNFTLQVTDSEGLKATARLTVNVTTNLPPTIGEYQAATVTQNSSVTVSPSAPPVDDGSATITATADGFTGTFATDPQTGVVTVSNAGPVGTFTVTVRIADTCGEAVTRTFSLTVSPAVQITSASYSKKLLSITGTGFGTSPTIIVNGTSLPASVIQPGGTDTSVTAKGGKKKLSLRKGENTIQVIGVGGVQSTAVTLTL